MRRLLVVSDLYLDPVEIETGSKTLPQLPALEELLHLGRPGQRHEDWRAGLAADLGARALAGVAPGQIAACAVPLPPGSAVCMAYPVHMVAGMASVHLHPAGMLVLDPDALAQLQAQFAREFGARDQALWAVGDGLLLAAPEAAAASASDPAKMLGNPVAVQRSVDPTQQALRRLGVEVEMWLSSLALNRERERRNELAITALWFWGGGRGELPGEVMTAPIWEQAFGGDPWLHGLWRRLAGRQVMAAQCWDEVTESSALVVASAARKSLLQLESDWFVPALRDLSAGRISSLHLRIGGQHWDLGSRPRSRWRRSRPWWQVLAA